MRGAPLSGPRGGPKLLALRGDGPRRPALSPAARLTSGSAEPSLGGGRLGGGSGGPSPSPRCLCPTGRGELRPRSSPALSRKCSSSLFKTFFFFFKYLLKALEPTFLFEEKQGVLQNFSWSDEATGK